MKSSTALIMCAVAGAAVWLLDHLPAGSPAIEQPAPHTQPRRGDGHTEPQPQTRPGEMDWRILFGNINAEWRQILPSYRAPRLVLFDGSTSAGCAGRADARSPFYCPQESTIYLSPSFVREIPCSGSPCAFGLAVVLAHEVGHHVQYLVGLDRGQGGQEVELRSDCLAGLWARHEDARLRKEGKPALVEPGDVEAALTMAGQFGDGGSHGTGAQRQASFRRGWERGTLSACTGGGQRIAGGW